MTDRQMTRQIERLKTVKSAFILEARSLADQGLMSLAAPLFRRSAELECELAGLFHARNQPANAQVSYFSAASCLLQARQYRSAWGLFQKVAANFPEAESLMEECRDKEDVPGSAETPAIEALVSLLVRKHVITEDDWVEALQAT